MSHGSANSANTPNTHSHPGPLPVPLQGFARPNSDVGRDWIFWSILMPAPSTYLALPGPPCLTLSVPFKPFGRQSILICQWSMVPKDWHLCQFELSYITFSDKLDVSSALPGRDSSALCLALVSVVQEKCALVMHNLIWICFLHCVFLLVLQEVRCLSIVWLLFWHVCVCMCGIDR